MSAKREADPSAENPSSLRENARPCSHDLAYISAPPTLAAAGQSPINKGKTALCNHNAVLPWDSCDKSAPRPNGAQQPLFAKPRWGIGHSLFTAPGWRSFLAGLACVRPLA